MREGRRELISVWKKAQVVVIDNGYRGLWWDIRSRPLLGKMGSACYTYSTFQPSILIPKG